MGYRNRIYTLWVFELQNMHKSNTLIFPHQTILFLALRESHIRKQGKTQRVHHLALAFVQTRRIHSQNLSQNIRCMVRIQFGEYAEWQFFGRSWVVWRIGTWFNGRYSGALADCHLMCVVDVAFIIVCSVYFADNGGGDVAGAKVIGKFWDCTT